MSLNFCNNNSLSAITALPASISGGGLNLISTQTASGSTSIEFTSGINSTYKSYLFKFYSIHPATDDEDLRVLFSSNAGSSYGLTKTTTYVRSSYTEGGSGAEITYLSSKDLAQSTSAQPLAQGIGSDDDQTCSGTMHLFNPSSSVLVKHFIADFNTYEGSNVSIRQLCAGYVNDSSAVDAVKFDGLRGAFDGVIKLYGIS